MLKRKLKDLIVGILIGSILTMTTPVLADTLIQRIDVVLNGVNVEVDGNKLDSSSILYNGSTYLPLRKVAEAVGKDVEWNQETMTANIVENTNIQLVGESMNEEFKTYQSDGFWFGEKNGELYYDTKYTFKLMREFAFYELDSNEFINNKNIKILSEDKKVLIDNVPYELVDDRIYISKSYYENTILPLIK